MDRTNRRARGGSPCVWMYVITVMLTGFPAAFASPLADTLTAGCGPLSIVRQPEAEKVVVEGGALALTVVVRVCPDGEGVGYQWFRDDTPVPGQTGATLAIAAVGKHDGGEYFCGVYEGSRSVNSDIVTVTVLEAVGITRQPSSATVMEGMTARFGIEAAGGGTLGYQWFRHVPEGASRDLTGENQATLTLDKVGRADSGSIYYCTVGNGVSTAASDPCTLNLVTPAPANTVESLSLEAESASRVNVAWTFEPPRTVDSIQILCDTVAGNVVALRTAVAPVTVSGTASSVLVSGLSRDTRYYFGLRVLRDGLWSAVGPVPALPSIVTPPFTCTERPPNTVGIDTAWFDQTVNAVKAAWRYEPPEGMAMEWGVTWGTDAAAVLDTAEGAGPLKWHPASGGCDTVSIDLRGRRDEALYTVCLWIRLTDCVRTLPADSSWTTVVVPAFAWDTVVYFPRDTVRAFGGDVVLERGRYGTARATGDRLLRFDPEALPAGFVRAGIGFRFEKGLPTMPFRVGIRCDSLPPGIDPRRVRLYRAQGGLWQVEHSSFVENGIVWVETNDLRRPFMALLDTVEPAVTLGDSGVPVQPLMPGGHKTYTFTVTDNIGNARWRFAYCPGNHRYGPGSAGEVTGTTGTVVRTVDSDSVSAYYGLRVHISVTDGVNTRVINGSRRVRSSNVTDIVVNPLVWTPVRVPGTLDSTAFSTVCDELAEGERWTYNRSGFRAFRWVADRSSDSSMGRWLEYSDRVADSFAVVPGRVIWVKCRHGTTIATGPGTTASLTDPLRLVLPPRHWTDFALPYQFKVLLRDVLDHTRVAGPNGPLDPDTLEVIHWVRDLGESRYVGRDLYSLAVPHLAQRRDTARLREEQTLAAYSVYNPYDAPVTLLVPPIPAKRSVGPGMGMGKRPTNPGAWSVALESSCPSQGTLNTVYCGVNPALAEPRYLPKRPSFKDAGVGVVNPRSTGVGAHAMIRELDNEGAVYELAFYNSGTETACITTRVADAGMLPESVEARLYAAADEGGSDVVTVDVAPGSTEYGRLVVGTKAYREGFAAAPLHKAALVGVRPNSRGDRLTLHYTLPAQGVRGVSFTAHDLRGRVVWRKRLRERLTAGPGTLVWNGIDSHGRPLAGGVYLVRMTVDRFGNEPPKTFSARATLVR